MSEANHHTSNRIYKVLEYIHLNLEASLSLDDIAKHSCWSRWQLQRVFQHQTGKTVANYVRELKLSAAAEQLLDTEQRAIDISVALGFNSEISFSRSFKQMFGVSPRTYRKLGVRTNLRKPIQYTSSFERFIHLSPAFIDVRVETREAFCVKGLHGEIKGLFSPKPDFAFQVPQLWFKFQQVLVDFCDGPFIGVIDVTHGSFDGSHLEYWATTECPTEHLRYPELHSQGVEVLNVPTQTYAVVTHRGPVSGLAKTLEWFLLSWLPDSGYRGIDGFELEAYPQGYDMMSEQAEMEYWVPITKESR